jgi:hypothetical protein
MNMEEEVVVSEKELEFWSWFGVFLQKGLNIRQKVLNTKEKFIDEATGKIKQKSLKRNLTEEEEQLLKVAFAIWRNGEFLLYEQKMEGTADLSTQTDIFEAIQSEESEEPTDYDSARDKILDGMDVDNVSSEPKIEEQK